MEIISNDKNRIIWLDYAKGIGIVLVVFGHIIDGIVQSNLYIEYNTLLQNVLDFIYSFHMQFFFILSGYVYCFVYRTDCGKKKILERILNLLLIYIEFSFALWVFKRIFSHNVLYSVSVKDLLMIPFCPISAYWYLYVLIIFYVLGMIKLNNRTFNILLLCSIFTSIFIKSMNGQISIGILYEILFYFSYFLFGIFACDRGKNRDFFQYVFLGVTLKIVAYMVKQFFFSADIRYFYDYVNAIGISLIIISLCMLFEKKQIYLGILQLVGRESMYIYVFHIYVVAFWKSVVGKMEINLIIYVILGTFLGLAFPMLYYFIEKKLGFTTFNQIKVFRKGKYHEIHN